ncbi:class I adenylate-forming enzyme family protein [Sulfuricystis multivorans]|uniref:class I adenylate-forming enzyme family protein n=1 Tax=Sulfuricystis multivorans TaxID=2211108 RepID=UPI000F81DA78|nr:AMP-binding protein [Sulfuricystis multivorans]
MQILRHWLSRHPPERPALILPDGSVFSYGALAGRRGRSGLTLLEDDAATLAKGLIDCGLGAGTAFPLPPHLSPKARARLIEQAEATANPRLALIIATSGSSGEPKGVRLAWRSIAAAARMSERAFDLQPNDAWLACLPLHFVAGATILYRCLRAGATAVVQEGFDVHAVARAFVERRITHVSLVPAMLARLLDAAVLPPPSLRCALVGGAALAPSLEERARKAGWPIRLSYGMTETCATALVDGRSLPGVRVRLSESGTLEVATPARMIGYLNEADVGEWLTTSDLATIDEAGRVTILGRADEMLISAGVNVHPLEVEAQLTLCPGVREAAVMGLPDPVWGDLIAAVYEGEADEAAVEAWSRARLPSSRRPRRFLRVARLPRLASGKLDRHAVRSLWS